MSLLEKKFAFCFVGQSDLDKFAKLPGPPGLPQTCPIGYSQHLASLEGCAIHYCVKSNVFNSLGLPTVRRPPYSSKAPIKLHCTYALGERGHWAGLVQLKGNAFYLLVSFITISINGTDRAVMVLVINGCSCRKQYGNTVSYSPHFPLKFVERKARELQVKGEKQEP